MAALPDLITVQQFGGCKTTAAPMNCITARWCSDRPKAKHYNLQRRFVRLLENRLLDSAGRHGIPRTDVAEFDLRSPTSRWSRISAMTRLIGRQPPRSAGTRHRNQVAIQYRSATRELASLGLANGARNSGS